MYKGNNFTAEQLEAFKPLKKVDESMSNLISQEEFEKLYPPNTPVGILQQDGTVLPKCERVINGIIAKSKSS
jgi:hypothetical protein